MYMYRKAMPRSSKILDEKWQQHLREMHHKRMKTIRPEIDNKAPARFVHLAQNLKRQQLDEERYSSIERANYLLLERMSHIMTHPQTVDMKQSLPPPKSLNKDGRKKELMRITEENHNILRRIQHKEPYYSQQEWTEEARRQEAHLRNICEFPPLIDVSRQRSTARISPRVHRQDSEVKTSARGTSASTGYQPKPPSSRGRVDDARQEGDGDNYEEDFE